LIVRFNRFVAFFRDFTACASTPGETGSNYVNMKRIDVSDEVYHTLKRLTTDFNQSPNDVLASLLHLPLSRTSPDDPLSTYLLGPEFRALFTDADKYLAILSWIAERHAADFEEYIASINRGRLYLSPNKEAIVAQCRHNQARQIPGTRYWAIMNIDTPTKRRFLTRVLDFCGYREEIADFTCNAIGMRRPARRLSFAMT
jgi:negative regulator of replication initiation